MVDLGQALGLGFAELGVGGDDADGGVGVGARQNGQRRHTGQQAAEGVAQAEAVLLTSASDQGAAARSHIA